MTTPTNDRQTSERERLATVVDELGSANVPQWWAHKAADQLRADESEIARARRTAEYWKAEHNAANAVIAALRAENEALRTVGDEDASEAVNSYYAAVGDGWQLPSVRGMVSALQSFIRSKESRRAPE